MKMTRDRERAIHEHAITIAPNFSASRNAHVGREDVARQRVHPSNGADHGTGECQGNVADAIERETSVNPIPIERDPAACHAARRADNSWPRRSRCSSRPESSCRPHRSRTTQTRRTRRTRNSRRPRRSRAAGSGRTRSARSARSARAAGSGRSRRAYASRSSWAGRPGTAGTRSCRTRGARLAPLTMLAVLVTSARAGTALVADLGGTSRLLDTDLGH